MKLKTVAALGVVGLVGVAALSRHKVVALSGVRIAAAHPVRIDAVIFQRADGTLYERDGLKGPGLLPLSGARFKKTLNDYKGPIVPAPLTGITRIQSIIVSDADKAGTGHATGPISIAFLDAAGKSVLGWSNGLL